LLPLPAYEIVDIGGEQRTQHREDCARCLPTAGVDFAMTTAAEEPKYTFSLAIDGDRAEHVTNRLIEFYQAHASPLWSHPSHHPAALHVYAMDASDTLIGGLIGRTNTIPEWLEITVLWVEAHLRGRSVGRELMRLAEEEAKRRGCRYARVNTAQFQAPGFYPKLGYTLYGQLDNCPQGETVYYFYKDLG
jgi:ribosomal protein S18 acetylase RimI-like enzyme